MTKTGDFRFSNSPLQLLFSSIGLCAAKIYWPSNEWDLKFSTKEIRQIRKSSKLQDLHWQICQNSKEERRDNQKVYEDVMLSIHLDISADARYS